MKKTLKITMLVDFMATSMGSTDDEYADIQGEITELLPECNLTFKKECYIHELRKMPESEWDIFVMDWGGLLPGADSLTESIYEELVELTYKHPNKLFILWSEFTKRYYLDAFGVRESKRLMHEELYKLISPNVIAWFDENKTKRCRLFFGLPETIKTKDEKPYNKYGTPTQLKTPKRRD